MYSLGGEGEDVGCPGPLREEPLRVVSLVANPEYFHPIYPGTFLTCIDFMEKKKIKIPLDLHKFPEKNVL